MELEEIFAALGRNRVRYLLIGGHASIIHGVPRTTVDVDIAISSDVADLKRCISALKGLGMSCDTEVADDILGQGGITFTNDRDIDVLTALPGGEDFGRLWKGRLKLRYHGVSINVVSRKDQMRLLAKAGRSRDIEDLAILKGT